MLFWAVVLLAIAGIAAPFGFGAIATVTAWIAKIVVVVFLALAAGAVAGHLRRRK